MADFPKLPAAHDALARYIAENPDKPMVEIMEPYRQYEAHLRGVFAQDRQNPILSNPNINVLPLFNQDTELITTRARKLEAESELEKSKYVMALPDDKRRPHGSPATVENLTEFQKNFNIFSESALTELDWSNVVAAGSSVINCLLPVPPEFNVNKRKLREYYHEKFCPASDVDLFLYGLTHEEAIEKIKQIEQAVKDSILHEVTVVRTKYALTIASQYPNRHIQIVLRVYKSISEILTGFDIDAAGGAYDGKQVYVTPRALGSFITQVNHVDLSRRSPSYENRLSKYSHRNFEVYWPDLDRSRIDPTIFERSFKRTLGLARLLVLERLPTSSVRDDYQAKRRAERGRPPVYRGYFNAHSWGDIKGSHEDEVSDWLSEEDVSSYHTFTIPYGQKFNAKKIEKLCYSRDLLLNAEWNQPKERPVYLHRHPAFFGRVQDVIEDCCDSCPVPKTSEEFEIAEKESEIYISGKISFLIDNPGRQQIGSFNPLTEEDWTDMAYVGNTARLCQSIVDGDIDDVLNWLSQDGADPNKRDYTGRAPLHLAVMASTPEVVKCLVDHGSRLTARLADGRTALHLASARGNVEMIKILMDKSIENEEEEEQRNIKRKQAINIDGFSPKETAKSEDEDTSEDEGSDEDEDEDSDLEVVDGHETEGDDVSMATGSFVKVKKDEEGADDIIPDESTDEPDFYKIDVLGWDTPCSPLHLAIVEGHEEAVKLLCDYGADSILPVKFTNNENAALLTLTLALSLPGEKAISMAELLLKQGAVSSQAETNGCTAFHRYVASGRPDLVDLLLKNDKSAVKSAINHMIISGWSWRPEAIAPLHTAISKNDSILVLKLLEAGASATIDFDTWFKSAKSSSNYSRSDDLNQNMETFANIKQPLLAAIRSGNANIVKALLANGADPNTKTSNPGKPLTNDYRSHDPVDSALDICRSMLTGLKAHTSAVPQTLEAYIGPGYEEYLQKATPGSYIQWRIHQNIESLKSIFEADQRSREEEQRASVAKQEALDEAIQDLEKIETMLLDAGAKTISELEPQYKPNRHQYHNYSRRNYGRNVNEYTFESRFETDKDMSSTRNDGYVELMEASWAGDIDKIKALTLQAWGPSKDFAPLKADIRDDSYNSPLSVAFIRGHIDAAWAILEIIKAQWSPAEKDEVRYKLRGQEDEEEYESDYDEDEDADSDVSDPHIVAEKVQTKFTIDDIGEVSMQVKSHTKPIDCLTSGVNTFTAAKDLKDYKPGCHGTLFRHVLTNEDHSGLDTLLDMANKYSEKPSDDEDSSKSFQFPVNDFTSAVQYGQVSMLRRIIKRCGAGIPFDHLLKSSGVQTKAKPRFYQGLTVYGKKRKDWANAGRNMVVRSTGVRAPPLLYAALGGCIENVEFFLGDAPHRLYKEFAKSDVGREDQRLKHLRTSPGGIDRVITKWLGTDNDWVLHCAVLADPGPQANELVSFLIDTCPASLERKNTTGCTPLMLAFSLGRTEFAKLLIEAGADQSTRDSNGENLVHAILTPDAPTCGVRHMLELLDPVLRSQLFLARTNLPRGGKTPLHSWISRIRHGSAEEIVRQQKMLELILDYSKGEELEMLNGAGDTCLHTAIMEQQIGIIHHLAQFKPKLLSRENAVGRTPAELAHDNIISKAFSAPENMQWRRHARDIKDWGNRNSLDFLKQAPLKEENKQLLKDAQSKTLLTDEYKPHVLAMILRRIGATLPTDISTNVAMNNELPPSVIWDICRTALLRAPADRRLVSLNEANDVARRLGESHSRSRYFSVETRRGDDSAASSVADGEEKDHAQDFVNESFSSRHGSRWEIPRVKDGGERPKKCKECDKRHGSYF